MSKEVAVLTTPTHHVDKVEHDGVSCGHLIIDGNKWNHVDVGKLSIVIAKFMYEEKESK